MEHQTDTRELLEKTMMQYNHTKDISHINRLCEITIAKWSSICMNMDIVFNLLMFVQYYLSKIYIYDRTQEVIWLCNKLYLQYKKLSQIHDSVTVLD